MKIETIVQSGHYLHINDVAFSPDSSLIATCSPDESVRLWDIRMGCEAAVLRGHIGPVYKVIFSENGQMLASCSWDLTIRLWDPGTRICKRVITIPPRVGIMSVDRIAFSPLGKYIASGCSSRGDALGYIDIWDCSTGERFKHFEVPENHLSAMEFSPDGRYIAVGQGGTDDVELRIISIASAEIIFYIQDKVLLPEEIASKTIRYNVSVSLTFSPDSKLLLYTCFGKVQIINIDRNEKLPPLTMEGIFKVQRDAKGNLIAFGQKAVSIWDVHLRKELDIINTVASCISPDGKILALKRGRILELIDRRSGKLIRQLSSQLQLPKENEIGNMRRQFLLCANPVYPILASAAYDGYIRLWDLANGGVPNTFQAHKNFIEAIIFNPQGSLLATGGDDGNVKLWHGKNGNLLHTIPVNSSVSSMAFSFDGGVLYAALNNGTVAIISLKSGLLENYTTKLHKLEPIAAIVVPFGGVIVTASSQELCFWNLNFENITTTDLGIQIHSLALSKAGILATGVGHSKWFGMADMKMIQGIISLFDPKVGFTHYLTGHTAAVLSVAFSPDGNTLISGGADGKIFSWDVQTGKKIFSIDAHAGDVTAVCYVAYGFFIASIGFDSVVRLWTSTSGELVATFISLNDEDYVSITAEGYYTATKPGLRSVMFRADNKIFPFDQFDLQLNRPDLVLEKLAFGAPELIKAYNNAYVRRMKSLGFAIETANVKDNETPKVNLLSDLPGPYSSDRLLQLHLQLVSPIRPLKQLLIYCNDVPVYGHKGIDITLLGTNGETFVDILLVAGDNKIQLCAVDNSGIKSQLFSFRTVFNSNEQKPDLLILAVGVSKYARQEFNLEFAAKDAQDLINEIEKLQTLFSNVRTRLLTDKDATKSAILASKSFLEKSAVDDHVIILFSGHGTINNGVYSFLPTDFDEASIESTGISYDEIQSLLDGVPVRRRLVLLDTCHAGEPDDTNAFTNKELLSSGVKRVRSFRGIGFHQESTDKHEYLQHPLLVRLPDLFADLRRDSGANIIAAAAASEYAREFEELENGVFTSCVIQALRNHCTDNMDSHHITVSALHHYVTKNVELLTGGKQRPLSRRENITDDFPVI